MRVVVFDGVSHHRPVRLQQPDAEAGHFCPWRREGPLHLQHWQQLAALAHLRPLCDCHVIRDFVWGQRGDGGDEEEMSHVNYAHEY